MRRVLLLLTLFSATVALYAAEEVPDWVLQAAKQEVPKYPAKVMSVVLFHEEAVTVEPDGRRVMRERQAIKTLQRSSDPLAATRIYNTKNGRIRDFQGWLLPASGKPAACGKNRVVDVALSLEFVYDEARVKVLECGDAATGSVFAWEVIEEERTVFTQDSHDFQRDLPVLVSRFVLTLPSGWETEGVVFNRDPIQPQVSGTTHTWELRNLPWIELEDYSPPLDFRVPSLALTFYPPAGNKASLPSLKDWASVSSWVSQLVNPAAEVTAAIRAKAAQLTSNAAGELDKIRTIAAFVQQTNYVEVALNITRGGGYIPRPAEETLAKNYGDCKDKATLMRALLKAAGIESYLTTIYSGDRHFVRPEWASPMQFNHAIIAIRVSEDVALPTVFEAPGLGRLLMFDPTDPITRVGDLPESEQGSHALILAGNAGALLRMPLLPPSANRVESSVEAVIDAQGRIEARLQQEYFGQAGRPLLAVRKLRGEEELKRRLERIWSRRLIGIALGTLEATSRPEQNSLFLNVGLTAERFAELLQDRLLIVRPGTLAPVREYGFTSRQRTSPVELDAALHRDSVKLRVPAGFKLEELPPPASVESPYGTLHAVWKFENGEILFEETLEIRNTIAPAADFAEVRDFFDKVGAALTAPVILIKE